MKITNNNFYANNPKPINFNARIAEPVNLALHVTNAIVNGNISKHFVPTPSTVVQLMLKELGPVKAGERVLEPSAGYGHIAEKLAEKSCLTPNQIDVIEPVESLRKILYSKGFNLVDYDILKYNPSQKYDKIIMNPPFDNGLDILHLIHSYSLLKPNGKLVAILPENDFIPPRQPGCEKWMKDWLGNGQIKEINEYLDELLKSTKSKTLQLGRAFLRSDVPDDVRTRLVVINKTPVS